MAVQMHEIGHAAFLGRAFPAAGDTEKGARVHAPDSKDSMPRPEAQGTGKAVRPPEKTLQNHFTSFVAYTTFLSEDDGTSAAEEAPVVPAKTAPCSEGVAACEDAPATTAETPLAAYRFMDERVWGWTLVLGSLALFFFALYHGTGIMSGSVLCFIMGIIRLVQTQQRLGRHACILYRDHLECVSGAWTSDLVSIPYASIREARYSSSKLRLLLASGDGTTRFNVYFYVLEGDKRDEARAVLRDKMRELGVLRED